MIKSKVIYYHVDPLYSHWQPFHHANWNYGNFHHANGFVPCEPAFDSTHLSNLCGIISPCFKLGFTNNFDMKFDPVPDIPTNFTHTFDDLVIRRAIELWELGKPIRLWWSGGIDSTCALIGLLQTKRMGDQLIVYLSDKSVEENPKFYDMLVREKTTFQWHSPKNYIFYNLENWNGETINVNGCGGDELFLSITDHIVDMEKFFNIKDTNWKNILSASLSYKESNSMILDIIEEYLSLSPNNVETCWELFWWLSRTIDDKSSMYMSVRFLEDPSVYHLDHAFFYSKDFELWSLSNPYAGHNGTPKSYKWPLKKFIYNFDKNKDYLDHKEKESSLPYIFENTLAPFGSIFTEHPIRNKIVYEDGTYVRAVWPEWDYDAVV